MKPQLTITQWVALPLEVRNKIVEIFKLPRSGHTEVINNQYVVSDGYTHEDLANLTEEKMQEYLGSGYTKDTQYFDYVDKVIQKIHMELNPEEETGASTVESVVPSVDEVELTNANSTTNGETTTGGEEQGTISTGDTSEAGSNTETQEG